jgi:putative transcriptional regulator
MAKYLYEGKMKDEYLFKDEKDLYSIIGKNIRYYRKLYSINNDEMTQEKLAEIINVSTSLIGNLESKKTYQGISIYNLYKISKILDVPIDNFFIDH